MNTDKPQPEKKKRSVLGTVVGAAGLAAATYAARNPEKVVRVAKKVFKVGKTALDKVAKMQPVERKRAR
jgi:hypothetical protein